VTPGGWVAGEGGGEAETGRHEHMHEEEDDVSTCARRKTT
jgi:hypothetical protein